MRIYQVDSFTDTPFKGNPAGVCIVENGNISDDIMQKTAAEMNLSETAFLFPQKEDLWNIRWFTPKSEIDLCGHATLAAAHILWETGLEEKHHFIRFTSNSGLLTAAMFDGMIQLDFPLLEVSATDLEKEVADALGVEPLFCGSDSNYYLIEIESPAKLKQLNPDFKYLANHSNNKYIVTSKCDTNEYDFVSRFFAPSIGINEDPVTGSAHCRLAPYWHRKLNKNPLKAFQASSRGGEITCEVKGGDRVLLLGKAVTVIKGELLI